MVFCQYYTIITSKIDYCNNRKYYYKHNLCRVTQFSRICPPLMMAAALRGNRCRRLLTTIFHFTEAMSFTQLHTLAEFQSISCTLLLSCYSGDG